MEKPTEVRVVLPAGGEVKSGRGARLVIDGREFNLIERLNFTSTLDAEDIVRSTLTITFAGDILVERADG